MHKGKVLSTANYKLQPFTVDLQEKSDMILDGLFRIFSNNNVTKFNMNRHFKKEDDAMAYILSTLNGYENKTHFDYFLIDLANDRLAGTVHLLSPSVIINSYPAMNYFIHNNTHSKTTWAIEYYLDPLYWKKGIMKHFINRIVQELFIQGATNVVALTDTPNLASINLLKTLSFKLVNGYKDIQGQVLWIKSL